MKSNESTRVEHTSQQKVDERKPEGGGPTSGLRLPPSPSSQQNEKHGSLTVVAKVATANVVVEKQARRASYPGCLTPKDHVESVQLSAIPPLSNRQRIATALLLEDKERRLGKGDDGGAEGVGEQPRRQEERSECCG